MNAEDAFSPSHDRAHFFASSVAEVALAQLQQGLDHARPVTVVIGEAGVGKSSLVREACARWGARVRAEWFTPPIAGETSALLEPIVRLFGGKARGDDSRIGWLAALSRTLGIVAENDKTALLIVEDAHTLTVEGLAELAAIHTEATSAKRALRIILVGAPALETRLDDLAADPLAQLVGIRCRVAPLPAQDVRHYLHHRVAAAGGDGDRVFSRKAARELHSASGGVPGALDALAAESIRAARKTGTNTVGQEHVRSAVGTLRRATTSEAATAAPSVAPVAAAPPAPIVAPTVAPPELRKPVAPPVAPPPVVAAAPSAPPQLPKPVAKVAPLRPAAAPKPAPPAKPAPVASPDTEAIFPVTPPSKPPAPVSRPKATPAAARPPAPRPAPKPAHEPAHTNIEPAAPPPPVAPPALPEPYAEPSQLDSRHPRVKEWVSRFTEGDTPSRFGARLNLPPITDPESLPSIEAIEPEPVPTPAPKPARRREPDPIAAAPIDPEPLAPEPIPVAPPPAVRPSAPIVLGPDAVSPVHEPPPAAREAQGGVRENRKQRRQRERAAAAASPRHAPAPSPSRPAPPPPRKLVNEELVAQAPVVEPEVNVRWNTGPRSPSHGRFLHVVVPGLLMLGVAGVAIWAGTRGGFEHDPPHAQAQVSSSAPVEAAPETLPEIPPVATPAPSSDTDTIVATPTTEPVPSAPPRAVLTPSPAHSDPDRYCLSVGTYLFSDRARIISRQLSRRTGLDAWVETIQSDGARNYKILLGGFATQTGAEKVADHLLRKGLVSEALVEPMPKGHSQQ